MTFSTRNFDPLTPFAPKFPNFAIQILLFRLKHTIAVVTHAHVLQNLYTACVRGVACRKTTFRTKIGGGPELGEHPEIWDPLRIGYLQPLKLATSNLVHNLGLRLAYQKRRLGPKLAAVWAGSTKKLGSSTYFCNR